MVPLNIVDLPIDILDLIVRCSEPNRTVTPPFECQNPEAKETMQSLRLTCRRFYHLTSRRLISHIRLSLDQKSLDLVAAVASNPSLSVGVQSVELDLSYRPAKVASDFAAFLDFRRPAVRRYDMELDWCVDLFEWSEDRGEVDEYPYGNEVPTEEYYTLSSRYSALHTAIGARYTSCDPSTTEELLVKEYRATLLRNWETYRLEHQKQYGLLMSSTFINELTRALLHMPNAKTFWFHDDAPQTFPKDVDRSIAVISDPTTLDSVLTAPSTWHDIEDVENDVVPGHILSELPISLHRAGISPCHLHIHCFPMSNQRALRPFPGPNGNAIDWSELGAASHALQTVHFGNMCSKPIRLTPVAGEDKRYMDGFLGAILSGKLLEDVDMDFSAFRLRDGVPYFSREREDDRLKGYHYVEDILKSMPEELPRLKSMRFSYAAVGQKTFERLCRSVGGLAKARFIAVRLVDGEWHPLKQVLRDRNISMGPVEGGEFGEKRMNWEGGEFIEDPYRQST
jgi:hypothetical protein